VYLGSRLWIIGYNVKKYWPRVLGLVVIQLYAGECTPIEDWSLQPYYKNKLELNSKKWNNSNEAKNFSSVLIHLSFCT